MLALTRKADERVILIDQETGRTIEVVVGGFRNNGVQLLFDAPKEVRILRKELIDGRKR